MSGSAYAQIAGKLASGHLVILDGGTGTDIQRRGVPMDGGTWCAEANRSHPEVVRAVHTDYIRAGADVITTNTYPTSPLLFNALERDRDLLEIDRLAIGHARSAREAAGVPVAIAGSFSVMRPVSAGGDRIDSDRSWTREQAMALFRAKAEGMAEAGVDLIVMEMMRDRTYSVWATEAALATGLPVWVGISVETDKASGRLVGFSRPDQPAEQTIGALAALRPAAMAIMHSSVGDTDLALPLLRNAFGGPIGAYPEVGYFKMPDWQFAELSDDDFVAAGARWRQAGAAFLGGCCGVGPSHIAALSRAAAQGKL